MSDKEDKDEKTEKPKKKKGDSMFTKIFRLYDEDNDGYIDLTFLPEMMRSAGAIFLDNELDKPMANLKTNNGGDYFTLKDYKELCTQFTQNEDTPEDLMEAFKFWDTDGSGKVTTDEIRQALTTLGDVLSEDEINALIKEADPTNIGVIDYEAYSKILFRKIN